MDQGKTVQEVEDVIQVLKYIKSLKGNYDGYAEQANSRDIKLISGCCYNLLEDNIPLHASKKNAIYKFLNPIQKEIYIIGNKKESVKIKREILSDPLIGNSILTLLTSTILPALVSALAREKPNGIDMVTEHIENKSIVDGNVFETNRSENSKFEFVDKVSKRRKYT